MKIIISQPRYLPVLSYINRLHFADSFILLDNVQRQARGWENRNQLLLNGEPRWITIPVSSSTRALISDSVITGTNWIGEHKSIIHQCYKNSPHFSNDLIEEYYQDVERILVESNFSYTATLGKLITNLCSVFGFTPKIKNASAFMDERINNATGVAKLVAISKEVKTDVYVSGANGKSYGVEEAFLGSGIEVKFHNFALNEYVQGSNGGFTANMGFFDALFFAGYDWTKKEITKPPVLLD